MGKYLHKLLKSFLSVFILAFISWGLYAQSNEEKLQSNLKSALQYAKSDPEKSLNYALKAESFAVKLRNLPAQAQLYTLIGNIYGLHEGKIDRAVDYHRDAFEIYQTLLNQRQIDAGTISNFYVNNVRPVYQTISKDADNAKRRDRAAIQAFKELYGEVGQFLQKNEARYADITADASDNEVFNAGSEEVISNNTSKAKTKIQSVNPKASRQIADDIVSNRALSTEQKSLYDKYIFQLEQSLKQKGIDINEIKAKFTAENERIKKQVSHLNVVILQKDFLLRQDSIINSQKFMLVDADKKIAEAKLNVQNLTYRRNVLILAMIGLFLGMIAFFYYRNAKIVGKQKSQIENQNIELAKQNEEINEQKTQIEHTSAELKESYQKITDNLTYTQTVQQAILPRPEALNSAFSDHFVIFMPKDIVSGDFYWFHQTPQAKYLVVADCTGHGVSGGFMSIIGYMLLNKLIAEEQNQNLANILHQLDISIQDILQQRITDNTDGMAISICKIEPMPNLQHRLSFAGSKQGLVYYQQSDNQLVEIKGDRAFIGGDFQQKRVFNTHQIVLNQGDILYLTTDGLIDQNNPARKKYTFNKLFGLLNEIKGQSLSAQKQQIQLSLRQHQADSEQRDDITFLGIRL
jgi:serine phosphatase RsbU (regulator of sigma subunit)